MAVQAVRTCALMGIGAVYFVQKSVQRAFSSLQQGMEKVANVVLPRNPVTGHREFRFLPTSVENALGAVYYNDLCPQNKICAPSDTTRTVSDVFKRLVEQCVRQEELKFEVRVMQDDKTVNAFCLPGGKIVITTGMIKKLEEQSPIKSSVEGEAEQLKDLPLEAKLAAVLGHEISHACAGHGRRGLQLKLISFLGIKIAALTLGYFVQAREERAIQKEKAERVAQGRGMTAQEETELRAQAQARSGLIQQFFEGIGKVIRFFSVLSHGRCNELEADKYGIKLAAKAGYRADAAIWFQHKFLELKGQRDGEKPRSRCMQLFSKTADLFSTHPPSQERLDTNRLTVQTIKEEGVEAIYPGA